MKKTIIGCILWALAFAPIASAQYAASAANSSIAAGEMNKKSAANSGGGAPSGACVAGFDFYLDTTAHTMYRCTTTNVWAMLADATGANKLYSVTVGTGGVTAGHLVKYDTNGT